MVWPSWLRPRRFPEPEQEQEQEQEQEMVVTGA
jgi:hypothetical protein